MNTSISKIDFAISELGLESKDASHIVQKIVENVVGEHPNLPGLFFFTPGGEHQIKTSVYLTDLNNELMLASSIAQRVELLLIIEAINKEGFY